MDINSEYYLFCIDRQQNPDRAPCRSPNIIARIHGQYLAAAGKGLPDVHTSSEQEVQAKVAVPGHGVVLVTFERMKHKHGRSTHTWWGAKRVEATDEVPQAE